VRRCYSFAPSVGDWEKEQRGSVWWHRERGGALLAARLPMHAVCAARLPMHAVCAIDRVCMLDLVYSVSL
jgi:hypothetical protein